LHPLLSHTHLGATPNVATRHLFLSTLSLSSRLCNCSVSPCSLIYPFPLLSPSIPIFTSDSIFWKDRILGILESLFLVTDLTTPRRRREPFAFTCYILAQLRIPTNLRTPLYKPHTHRAHTWTEQSNHTPPIGQWYFPISITNPRSSSLPANPQDVAKIQPSLRRTASVRRLIPRRIANLLSTTRTRLPRPTLRLLQRLSLPAKRATVSKPVQRPPSPHLKWILRAASDATGRLLPTAAAGLRARIWTARLWTPRWIWTSRWISQWRLCAGVRAARAVLR
jgi:hypothetical protein